MWYTWKILGYLYTWRLCTGKCPRKTNFQLKPFMLAEVKLGFLVPGASHNGFPWQKLLTFNKSQLLIEFPCIRLTYLKLLSIVVFPSCPFLCSLCCLLDSAAWHGHTTGDPSPSYTPGCWYYKTENYHYSLSYTCIELLLRERTQILIPFSNFEIDWALWPCGLRHGSATTRWLGLWVQIPPETWMSVLCECCVLSEVSAMGQSLISEEFYQACVHAWERSYARLTLHLQCAVRRGQTKKEKKKRNFVTK